MLGLGLEVLVCRHFRFEYGLINQVAKQTNEQKKLYGVEIPLLKLSGFFSAILRFVVGEIETTFGGVGNPQSPKRYPAQLFRTSQPRTILERN